MRHTSRLAIYSDGLGKTRGEKERTCRHEQMLGDHLEVTWRVNGLSTQELWERLLDKKKKPLTEKGKDEDETAECDEHGYYLRRPTGRGGGTALLDIRHGDYRHEHYIGWESDARKKPGESWTLLSVSRCDGIL